MDSVVTKKLYVNSVMHIYCRNTKMITAKVGLVPVRSIPLLFHPAVHDKCHKVA
jgi:hypothetical protein